MSWICWANPAHGRPVSPWIELNVLPRTVLDPDRSGKAVGSARSVQTDREELEALPASWQIRTIALRQDQIAGPAPVAPPGRWRPVLDLSASARLFYPVDPGKDRPPEFLTIAGRSL